MAEANTFTRPDASLNRDGVTNTSWIDETFETGHMQPTTSLFTKTGNERGNYYLSLSHMDNNGIIGGDADRYSRLTAAINAEYDIKDWLKVRHHQPDREMELPPSIVEQRIRLGTHLRAYARPPSHRSNISAMNAENSRRIGRAAVEELRPQSADISAIDTIPYEHLLAAGEKRHSQGKS